MILEKALIEYDKKGDYDHTIESKYIKFNTIKEIREYIENNLEKDIEYYIYDKKEDIEKGNHKEVIICNEYMKGAK